MSNISSRYGARRRQRSTSNAVMKTSGCSNRPIEIQACLLPVALNRPLRRRSHCGDFREGEAAEEFEIDQLRQRRIDGGEFVQRVADRRELLFVGQVYHIAFDGCDLEVI